MRLLYTAIFTWLVFTGGRFTAPFLEQIANFNDALIGLTIALQTFVGLGLSTIGSVWADRMEASYPKRGRVGCMIMGIFIATLAFESHLLVNWIFSQNTENRVNTNTEEDDDNFLTDHTTDDAERWRVYVIVCHILLRVIVAICYAVLFPVLDGATMAYLELQKLDKSQYGKQRLFGAVGWAGASIIVGFLLDYYSSSLNYHIFFITAPIGSIFCIIVGILHVQDLERIEYIYSTQRKRRERKGSVIITEENVTNTDDEDDGGGLEMGEISCNSMKTTSTLGTSYSSDDDDCEENVHKNKFNKDDASDYDLSTSKNNTSSLSLCDDKNDTIRSLSTSTTEDELSSSSTTTISPTQTPTNNETSPSSSSSSSRTSWELTLELLQSMIQTKSHMGFLISSITLNMGTSVVENLIFLYFQKLGASNTMCGISVLITVVCEIPIFYYAPKAFGRFFWFR